MEIIRPSADLRNHYAEISRQCRETRRAVHITVNGRSDTVLMSAAEYEQMNAELTLLRLLAAAEEDVRLGRTAPAEDSFAALRDKLAARRQA